MKYKDGNVWKEINIKALDSMPIGSIILFAGSTIPTGWLVCRGQSLYISDYSELYAVIGTTYGTGMMHSTTFATPNLKGRVPVGIDTNDTDFDTLGETGGEKTHTLTINEMPSHNHIARSHVGSGVGDGMLLNGNSYTVDNNYTTGSTGGGQAHNILQPYIVVNYIIKAKDTTPVMASITDSYSTSTQDGYSCNYVNTELNKTKWQTLGTINNVGQGYALNIPSGAKELNIDCFENRDDGVSLNILTSNLSSNSKGYDGGFYKNSNDMLRVLIYATSSKVWVQEFVQNGSSKSSLSVGCTINYK